jgi:hypothetical protein
MSHFETIYCNTHFVYQMYGLMNEISDIYNKRLFEYADKQEIFDVKMYVYLLLILMNLNASLLRS